MPYPFPGISQPVIPAGVGEHQRVIHDIAITIIRLQVLRILYLRIRTDEASDQRVVDTAIHVDQTEFVYVFVVGEAAFGVDANYSVVGVGGAVREATFAVGFIGEPFNHGTGGVGNGGGAAKVVAVEVDDLDSGVAALGNLLDDADYHAVGGQVAALFCAVVEFDLFLISQIAVIAGVEVDGGAFTAGDFFCPLVFGSVQVAGAGGGAAEGLRHIEAGVSFGAAGVGYGVVVGVILGFAREVAVSVVAVNAVAAGTEVDAADGVGANAAGAAGRVAVGADIGAADDVAKAIKAEVLGDDAGAVGVDGGAGEAVEAVVEEAFGERLVGVGAAGDVA